MKDATASLHLEAERYVRILDADTTVDDYARYLVAMHGYVAPLEARLALADRERRCVKATWLHHDLGVLGVTERPLCAAVPHADSVARTLGCAYVLEGSTLGGRYILAKLPPTLAALRGRATRYLDGYGGETGAMWRSFGEVVERTLTTREEEEDAVAAACETFARLVDWLARFEERREAS